MKTDLQRKVYVYVIGLENGTKALTVYSIKNYRREEEYKKQICATPHHGTQNDWPSSPMFAASRT